MDGLANTEGDEMRNAWHAHIASRRRGAVSAVLASVVIIASPLGSVATQGTEQPDPERLVDAVRAGDVAAVDALVSAGVDVNVTQADGATALAEELEVTVDDLAAARKQVALNRVDDAVEAGKITEEQAEEIRAKIESGEGREHGRGHHGFGKRGGKHFDAGHDKDKDGDSITEETATTE